MTELQLTLVTIGVFAAILLFGILTVLGVNNRRR